MLAVVKSVGISGLEGYIIDVEVFISKGLPAFDIVGLPDISVRESKERVRAAIKNSGFEFPLGRITVNLAPADTKKGGPSLDLAIAVGLLAASGQLACDNYAKFAFLGELSLDGSVRGVTGVLPSVMSIQKNARVDGVIVPEPNAGEAGLVKDIKVFPVKNLIQSIEFLKGNLILKPHRRNHYASFSEYNEDMSEIKGNAQVKRALEIAAAGGHNLLMIGPPGSGKTMMARRIKTIMPEMTFEEALEVTKIYSIAGLVKSETPLITQRPFRAPHHHISKTGIIGGGNIPKPGEITLAHYGVLFMDEFPEYKRDIIEALRQPLEEGKVFISRINHSVEYPAKFMLITAMNPCPCGFYGHSTRECKCTPLQVQRYRSKLSGPLLDRIDLHVDVPGVDFKDLNTRTKAESSEKIRKRVEEARQLQKKRFLGKEIYTNAEMSAREVRAYCQLNKGAGELMKKAFERLSLSARSYNKVLKVARTIADLQGEHYINENHIAESIQFRTLDRYQGLFI